MYLYIWLEGRKTFKVVYNVEKVSLQGIWHGLSTGFLAQYWLYFFRFLNSKMFYFQCAIVCLILTFSLFHNLSLPLLPLPPSLSLTFFSWSFSIEPIWRQRVEIPLESEKNLMNNYLWCKNNYLMKYKMSLKSL